MALRNMAALAVMCGFCAGQAMADETADDIQCLSISLRMSTSGNPDDQGAAMLSTLYWLGRLDSMVPKPDLEKQLQAGAFDMRPADQQAVAERCATALKAGGELLTKLGQGLDQRQNSN
ncbi:MAG TPA: hypothetical protein VG501_01230 [Rhizomicrobium sp.]|nr:hypothetical protein [Rhizomicrobium sp.]